MDQIYYHHKTKPSKKRRIKTEISKVYYKFVFLSISYYVNIDFVHKFCREQCLGPWLIKYSIMFTGNDVSYI